LQELVSDLNVKIWRYLQKYETNRNIGNEYLWSADVDKWLVPANDNR
jgi:hypothetical protein